jgi:hypothetical protein
MQDGRTLSDFPCDRPEGCYIEGSDAFDLLGNKRCEYNRNTGNLFHTIEGKVICHVSLEGKFVGASWIADELFPKIDNAPADLRGIDEAPSQLLFKPSEVTTLTDLPEEPSTPHATEVLDSPEEPSAHDPTQVSYSRDANKERAVESQRVSGPVQGRFLRPLLVRFGRRPVRAPLSPEEPSPPHPTEVLDSPKEPRPLDPTQVSYSNDANKEPVVEFLRVSGPVQGRFRKPLLVRFGRRSRQRSFRS